MSRWRLCSLRSPASTVPLCWHVSRSAACAILTSSTWSAMPPSRRPRSRSEQNGEPPTGASTERAAADRHRPLGVARLERERRRRLRDHLHHELAIPAHALAVDVLPERAQQLERAARGAPRCRSPRGSSSRARAPPRRRRASGSRSPPSAATVPAPRRPARPCGARRVYRSRRERRDRAGRRGRRPAGGGVRVPARARPAPGVGRDGRPRPARGRRPRRRRAPAPARPPHRAVVGGRVRRARPPAAVGAAPRRRRRDAVLGVQPDDRGHAPQGRQHGCAAARVPAARRARLLEPFVLRPRLAGATRKSLANIARRFG